MPQEHEYDIGDGSVRLGRDGWLAVMAALEGHDEQRDAAFDVLQRWAPAAWIQELDGSVVPSRSNR